MDELTPHPALAAALATFAQDEGFTVRGFVARGDEAAAVLLSDGMTERTVIIEHRSGQWQSPTMVSGNPWDPSQRPTVTEEPWAVGQASLTQWGLPGSGGLPPTAGWLAVAALAAPDAVAVVVTTDVDSHEVAVNSDGVVLALVNAPWGARPDLTVRTTHGDVVRTAP